MAIVSFLHAGLERFARTGDTSGIIAGHAPKVNQLLAQLSFSGGLRENLRQVAGFHPVSLKFQTDLYAVKVNASWRLTFRVSDSGDISDLNYVQYH